MNQFNIFDDYNCKVSLIFKPIATEMQLYKVVNFRN
jgi:hypothetical protein